MSDEKLFDLADGMGIPIEDRNVGYVFQNYAMFPHITVYDNVAFGPRMRKVNDVEERVRSGWKRSTCGG